MRSGGCPPGRAARCGSTRSALPVRFCRERCRGRRAGARCRASSRTRRGATLAARHAHGAQYAGRGLCRHFICGLNGRRRRACSRSCSSTRDPSLTLPLFLRREADEALAEWRAWSEVLDVPLLLAERGERREPNARLGQIHDRAPTSAPPPPQRAQKPAALDSAAARQPAKFTERDRRSTAANARSSRDN